MKNHLKLTLFTAVFTSLLLFSGCDGITDSLIDDRLGENPLPDPFEASAGSADFSNYVAIGNSLTAGFMDAALYDLSQRNSLGAHLGKQFTYVGGTENFTQPDINSQYGFNTSVTNPGPGGVVFGRFKLDPALPGPSPVFGGDPIAAWSGQASTLNNFGVPGLRMSGLLDANLGNPASPSFNPFYARFASSPGVSTVLADAISANPTFFSLWLGNNEVLGFALSGGTAASALVNPADFSAQLDVAVDALMSQTSAKGVVIDVPAVLEAPFFNLIPYNIIVLDQATADMLNAGFAGFNQVLDALPAFGGGFTQEDADRRKVHYQAGANPVLIVDHNMFNLSGRFQLLRNLNQINDAQLQALLPLAQARPITSEEKLLLSASAVLGTLADPTNPATPIGVAIPLPPQFSLTVETMQQIETTRQALNASLKAKVTAVNSGSTRLALYETNAPGSAFYQMFGLGGGSKGIQIGTQLLLPDFSPSGVFSTDGIHPNARGTAIVANEIIKSIEAAFGANIPPINVLNLPGVQICGGDCASQQALMMTTDYSKLMIEF